MKLIELHFLGLILDDLKWYINFVFRVCHHGNPNKNVAYAVRLGFKNDYRALHLKKP